MTIKERSDTLKANPVTSVTMFQYRVESFFTHYILDETDPVGKVKEYAIKIEFQERGSPHAHCLLWVDGAPHIDVDDDEQVCLFIDKYVSGRIPEDSHDTKHIGKMVKQYETHSHSAYCHRGHSCQFGFPKAPSPKTIICREPNDDENWDTILKSACDVLTKVHELIDATTESQTLDSILDKAHISTDTYINALKVSHRGRSVILKCDPSDVNINGCNHEILCLWGANIDFQFVLDEYSTVMYICSYMMKSEKAMGEVLKSVARECQSEPIDQQLKKIGKTFVGHRVVSAPEAAMHILSMWLMKKSRKVTFVNSNMRDDRISLPKNNKTLGDMDEDEENVYMTSIHDRYASRPDLLNDMCLAKFAVNYEPVFEKSNTSNTDDSNDINNDSDEENDVLQNRESTNVIHLKNNLGVMRK